MSSTESESLKSCFVRNTGKRKRAENLFPKCPLVCCFVRVGSSRRWYEIGLHNIRGMTMKFPELFYRNRNCILKAY